MQTFAKSGLFDFNHYSLLLNDYSRQAVKLFHCSKFDTRP